MSHRRVYYTCLHAQLGRGCVFSRACEESAEGVRGSTSPADVIFPQAGGAPLARAGRTVVAGHCVYPPRHSTHNTLRSAAPPHAACAGGGSPHPPCAGASRRGRAQEGGRGGTSIGRGY